MLHAIEQPASSGLADAREVLIAHALHADAAAEARANMSAGQMGRIGPACALSFRYSS